MSVLKFLNENINKVKAYEPGRPIEIVAQEFGLDPKNIIKLASNECPIGVSPLAARAMRNAIHEMNLYPDPGAFFLTKKLSSIYGLDQENFVIGDGSNELLVFIAQCFLSNKASVVTSKYAFALYKIITLMFGNQFIEAPMKNFTFDLDAILKCIKKDTRVIFICNPNNPTSTMVKAEEISAFMEKVPEDILIVFDEAYSDITIKPLPDTLQYVKNGRDVVILKSFSKSYGLAGLRIGYAISTPEIAKALNKPRQPFNFNRMAQVAATAALDDHAFINKAKEVYRAGIKQISEGCEKLGLKYVSPVANFMLINVGDGVKIFNELQKEGIIVRPMKSYELPEWIRVSIGTEEGNQKFLNALERKLQP